jgi:hypothetical protein
MERAFLAHSHVQAQIGHKSPFRRNCPTYFKHTTTYTLQAKLIFRLPFRVFSYHFDVYYSILSRYAVTMVSLRSPMVQIEPLIQLERIRGSFNGGPSISREMCHLISWSFLELPIMSILRIAYKARRPWRISKPLLPDTISGGSRPHKKLRHYTQSSTYYKHSLALLTNNLMNVTYHNKIHASRRLVSYTINPLNANTHLGITTHIGSNILRITTLLIITNTQITTDLAITTLLLIASHRDHHPSPQPPPNTDLPFMNRNGPPPVQT